MVFRNALRLAVLVPALALAAPGCAGRDARKSDIPSVPAQIDDLDLFAMGLDAFALVPLDHPQREEYRSRLRTYLVAYIHDAIEQGDPEEALEALEFATGLYHPRELKTPRPAPDLVQAAREVYREAARRGYEQPSLLALATIHTFGDPAARARALEQWAEVEGWLVRNSMFSDEPLLRHEELERTLEEVAAVFPPPFVVRRLAELYVARYQAATRQQSRGQQLAMEARHRAEVTGYLLIRLFLRADDFDGLDRALAQVGVDPPTRKLMDLVERAKQPARSAGALLTLAAQFVPMEESEDDIPPVFVTQGWGIAANLGRRALANHPNDPFAHFLMGRVYEQNGLPDAAIFHLREVLQKKDDYFEAWARLARLEQASLARLASVDPDRARARLPRLERFHARAVDTWHDRPVEPGMPVAYTTVGEAFYDIGRADEAVDLLERGVAVEPLPEALDLLATVALKRNRADQARQQLERLTKLAHGSEHARLHWTARVSAQLAEVARRDGRMDQQTTHLRDALHAVNAIMSIGGLARSERAVRHVERGRILFDLKETSLAMEDFRAAIAMDPESIQVYADPLMFLVPRGYYDFALEIYDQAMSRPTLEPSLKIYFSLWVAELAHRTGQPPSQRAETYLDHHGATGWEGLLARHATGKLSFQQLLDKAGDTGERAEAFFYEGLRRWSGGDAGGGKELMQQVLDTQMMGFVEYEMAERYLEWGALPRPK